MENNNSKQVILSIVGVAILVIAVVGVSFAFFTYSRTGEKNNVITTGSITFELAPNSTGHPNIEGTDSFPQTDDEGPENEKNSTDFDVTGSLPAGSGDVTYWVYAIPGSAPADKAPSGVDWIPFDDSEINMYITATGAAENEITYTDGFNTKPGKVVPGYNDVLKDSSSGLDKGLLLATGTLGAGKSIKHQYSLYMWVNSTVTVSDTDSSYTYRASSTDEGDIPTDKDRESNTDDREIYSDHYYSVKIKVVASDDPSLK